MADIKVTLELDNKQYVSKLKESSNQAKQFSQSVSSGFDGMAGSLSGLTTKIAGIGSAFIGVQAILSSMSLADELDDLSNASGVSLDAILALQGAIELSGGKADDAGRMITRLQKSLMDARDGASSSQDKLAELGLSLSDIANLSPEEAIKRVVSSLAGMEDATKRNALAYDILGKSAASIDWVGVKNGIADTQEEQKRYADVIKEASQIGDDLTKSTRAMKLSLLELIKPIMDVYQALKEMGGTSEIASFAGKVLAETFKAIALIGSDVYFVINRMVAGVVALGSAGLAVVKGELSEASKIMSEYSRQSEEMRKKLDDLQQRVASGGPVGTKAEAERISTPNNTSDIKKNADAIELAANAQIKAIQNIATAFAKANERTREKIKLDTELIGSTDLYRKVKESDLAIDQAAQQQIDALILQKSKLKNTLNDQAQKTAIDATIESIKKQAQVDKETAAGIIKNQADVTGAYERTLAASQRISKTMQSYYADYFRSVNELKKIGQTPQQTIETEAKFNTILNERTALFEAASVALKDQPGLLTEVQKAISSSTSSAELLGKSYYDIGQTIDKELVGKLQKLGISDIQIQQIVGVTKAQRQAIEEVGNSQAEVGSLIREKQRDFVTGWKTSFNQYVDDATNAAKQAQSIFEKLTQGLEDAFVNFAKTGKLSFRDMLNSIAEDLLRSNIKQLLAKTFSFSSSGSGGLFSSIGKLLGFADGGIIPTNGPVLVGERGPELLFGAGGSRVIPNNQLGGGSTSVVYNISAVDAASFQQLVARDPAFLFAVTEQGRKSLPGGRR